MPKVSVVIPFYNTEKYIERCARSLFSQTLGDIEFIFVDDCSTDKSNIILNELLQKFPERISNTVILKNDTNQGCPLSRIRGISMAKGEYIIGCDGDDTVEPQTYELMYQEAVRGDCDMVICDYDRVYPNGCHINSSPQKPSGDLLKDLLTNKLDNYMWNKLIRRTIFENPYICPTASVWEDVGLIIQLSSYCTRVSAINMPLYHYYVNATSLMNSGDKRNRAEQMKENVHIVEEFLGQRGLLKKYSNALVRHKAYILTGNFNVPWSEYVKVYPEIRFKLFLSPYVPMPKKLGHLSKLLGIHGISRIFRKFSF